MLQANKKVLPPSLPDLNGYGHYQAVPHSRYNAEQQPKVQK